MDAAHDQTRDNEDLPSRFWLLPPNENNYYFWRITSNNMTPRRWIRNDIRRIHHFFVKIFRADGVTLRTFASYVFTILATILLSSVGLFLVTVLPVFILIWLAAKGAYLAYAIAGMFAITPALDVIRFLRIHTRRIQLSAEELHETVDSSMPWFWLGLLPLSIVLFCSPVSIIAWTYDGPTESLTAWVTTNLFLIGDTILAGVPSVLFEVTPPLWSDNVVFERGSYLYRMVVGGGILSFLVTALRRPESEQFFGNVRDVIHQLTKLGFGHSAQCLGSVSMVSEQRARYAARLELFAAGVAIKHLILLRDDIPWERVKHVPQDGPNFPIIQVNLKPEEEEVERQRFGKFKMADRKPQNVDGILFTTDEVNIRISRTNGKATIFHSKEIPYSIKRLVYSLDEFWVIVIMSDGKRYDLGISVSPLDRSTWEMIRKVTIARIHVNEIVKKIIVPLDMTGERSDPRI